MKENTYRTIYDKNGQEIGFSANDAGLDYEYKDANHITGEHSAQAGIPVYVQIIAHYSKMRKDCDKLGL